MEHETFETNLCNIVRRSKRANTLITLTSMLFYIVAESTNVNCSFQDADTCGYTPGSCWASGSLSYDVNGKQKAIFHACIYAACFIYTALDSFVMHYTIPFSVESCPIKSDFVKLVKLTG